MKTLTTAEVKNDLENNRNHSWIQEIYNRHEKEMDREVLYYFGNNITYSKLFDESKKLAAAMKNNKINKGDEFVVFTDRIPEFVYIMAAANMIGAKVTFVSEKFEEKYIKTIISNANSKLLFVQDNKIDKLQNILQELNDYKIVKFSHKRSLINNDYSEIFNKFYSFKESQYTHNYVDYDEFLKEGLNYSGKIFEKLTLDDDFTTTFSSGTTKKGHPKGIVHTNRHYITMGRYHDPEVSGVPSLKNLRTYSNVPVYSNTYISSSLSDNLIMGGKVILDPIDDPNYFIIGMKLHKGNMNVATPSTWLVNALNYYQFNDEYHIKELPDALFNFAGGEQLSAGEEKFLNKFLKDLKCGTGLTHTGFSIAKMCTAGADCEHGSIFYRLLRDYYNKLPYRIGRTDPIGMKVYDFVDIQVLREDGTYCNPLEHGKVVVNSACTMKGYSHDDEETKAFYIKDAYGKTWGNMNLYGYLDEKHNITMKGRYVNDGSIPTYRIADQILIDTKKIMSCEVVCLKENDHFIYVAHIVPQFGVNFNKERVLQGALQRCINKFGNGIENILYFRIRQDYPLAQSAKRDILQLKDEGIQNAERVIINKNDKKDNILKRVLK